MLGVPPICYNLLLAPQHSPLPRLEQNGLEEPAGRTARALVGQRRRDTGCHAGRLAMNELASLAYVVWKDSHTETACLKSCE